MIENNIKDYLFDEIEKIISYRPSAEQIFDYIYGVLNTKHYVEKYNDLLKQNYPRIVYPTSMEMFETVVYYGNLLKAIHLDNPGEYLTRTEVTVNKHRFDDGKLYLNKDLYLEIDSETWEFKIGACQVIKNWIKSREGESILLEEFKNIIWKVENTIYIKEKLNSSWSL